MKKNILTIIFFTGAMRGIAQAPPPPPPAPTAVPIDTGVVFLMAGALILGAFQLQKMKKLKKTSDNSN